MKLQARDADDLAILSACLQDALVNVQEMKYLPAERRFVLVANRFRWELEGTAAPAEPEHRSVGETDAPFVGDEDGPARYERVHCGVCFELVRAVQSKGLRGAFRPRFLELLALQLADGALLIRFAGAATVRLEIAGIRVFLEDLGEAWPTSWRPAHPDEPGSAPP
jgi:hypothetical protein